jgi:hypothetical protein
MYKLLVWSLLAFVPFTGVRMVCIDRPAAAVTSTATGDDCDQFCLRSNAPKPDVRSGTVECMLVAECSLLASVSFVAVLPDQTSITCNPPERKHALDVADYYLAPVLAQRTPPPKA